MQMNSVYYVYVLLSKKDKKFYIGFTRNLKRRIEEHNTGKNISTKGRRPILLVYYECHLDKYDALRRESYFKTSSGKKTLKLIIRHAIASIRQSLL